MNGGRLDDMDLWRHHCALVMCEQRRVDLFDADGRAAALPLVFGAPRPGALRVAADRARAVAARVQARMAGGPS